MIMETKIKDKKVAIVVADGFEQEEFTNPLEALRNAGAQVDVISLQAGKVKAWSHTDWGQSFDVDKTIEEVRAEEYDALVLPGGVMNPDKLRVNPSVVSFVGEFM